ncbi:MAG: bifunctional DNA-formamidopyrimidine glycosylase/DNA-(apurinic or apyrimidinic site) lyase [Terriglobales bacterium]
MPELPEVETIRRDLEVKLLGHRVLGAQVLWEREVGYPDAPTFAAEIAGRDILALERRAKYLIVHLSEGASLLVHLKMTGQLLYVPRDVPPHQHARAVFALDRDRELRFVDIRKFGRLYLVPTARLADFAKVAHLGPEPLAASFTVAALRALLANRRGRMKPLLMNQEFLAGLGNIYVDEALFRAGLHPLRSAESLKPRDVARLHEAIVAVLEEAIGHRGSSINNYRDPAGQKGYHHVHLRVFNRADEPCTRCGTPISKIRVGGRGTHFCPRCQRLPRRPAGGTCSSRRWANPS